MLWGYDYPDEYKNNSLKNFSGAAVCPLSTR